MPGLLTIAVGLALWFLLAGGRIVERSQDLQPLPEATRADIWRAFAVLAITMSVTTIVYTAFTTMLPKWLSLELEDVLGDNLTALGAMITAIFLLGATSQLLGGHLGDKGAAKSAYIASYALKIAALCAASMMTGWPLVIAAILVVFAFDIAAPIENLLIARFSPSRRRGLAYGFRSGLAVVGAPLGGSAGLALLRSGRGFPLGARYTHWTRRGGNDGSPSAAQGPNRGSCRQIGLDDTEARRPPTRAGPMQPLAIHNVIKAQQWHAFR